MNRERYLCIFIVCGIFVPVIGNGQKITFPSGEVFEAVDPASIQGNATDVADPKNTGALLFNADAYHQRRLTSNFCTKDFRSLRSPYFRAHPLFMECLQKIRTRLQLEEKDIEIVSGFKSKPEVAGSSKVQDVYARTGCGATLKFKAGNNADIKDLAAAAVTQCTLLFSRELRDIGIVIMVDQVAIHMTGLDDTVPQFLSDGNSMTNDEFRNFCLNELENAISPMRGPDCGTFPGLAHSEVYPTGATSAEAVVGAMDEKIDRSSPDFKRLLQYMGMNVDFEDTESGAAWCGNRDNPCADCKANYHGNAISTRCADRLMSHRLYRAIVILQKLVRETTGDKKLKVLEAWDEAYDGNPKGDSGQPNSLHYEGRAAKLQISGQTDEDSFETLSWLAICSGMDYVANNGDHIFVSVKKQASLQAHSTQFTDAELLEVLPPSSKSPQYKVEPEEEKQHPLYDSSNMESTKLGPHSTIGMFKSTNPDVRYLRLDTAISACFDTLYTKEQMLSSGKDKISVLSAYMPTTEQNNVLEDKDKRFNKFNLGMAMTINYSPPKSDNSVLLRLVKSAIDRCAYLFSKKNKQMGIGLYAQGVYIDMRSTFDLWKGDDYEFPPGISTEQYDKDMRTRYEYAMNNRIIDPDDLEAVCRRTVAPERQSPEFQHRHPAGLVQHRLKRSAGLLKDEQCVPNTNTAFCRETASHRNQEVKTIWDQVKRKHLLRNKDDVTSALDGCFKVCGTCVTGQVYENKVENCNNLLHWVPFTLMNEKANISNLYASSNLEMKRHACYAGEHCVDGSPLFSLIAPSFNRRYRPDPRKSPEEELYSLSDNPSPIYELLHKLYAMHANGTVKVWVKDEMELSTLRLPLQMAMAFNRNVTDVKFYVSDAAKIGDVSSMLENMIAEWVKTTCTHWGREFIPPFTIEELPAGISKRSADSWAAREEFILKEQNWEKEWLRKTNN